MTTRHIIDEGDLPGRSKQITCDALEELPAWRLREIDEAGIAQPSLRECGNHFVKAPDDASSLKM